MKNNTDIDYKNAIKAKYEKEKKGDFHSFLDHPSPAQLRELCLLKYDNGLNKIDEGIFKIYFKINETENLRNAIFNYHIPKFKSLGNFLAEEKRDKNTSIQNLNLLAVLVDYDPRPFNKFSNSDLNDDVLLDIEKKEEIELFKGKQNETIVSVGRKEQDFVIDKPKSNLKKRVGIAIVSLLGLFSISYTAKDMLFPEKQCMVWKENHYEMIDCQTADEGIASYEDIKPYDANDYKLVKLIVCDTTTFFVGSKAIVWYSKVNGGELEYFNHSGFHPVSGKPLRPITEYIIDKYVEPCK
jgi:hypothetical protein